MIYYAIFILYPVFQSIYNSFHTISPFQGELISTFVGIDNYKRLLEDDIFILSVKNTLIWGLIGPTLEMLVATTLAIIVYFEVPLHRFFRAAWFTPLLVSGVIVGLVFRWIFNFDWGLLNVGLRAIGLDNLAVNWLGRRDTPLYAVIFVHFWATFGYSFILLLAGLTAIPKELIEAARIDGASTRRIATEILIPLLRPTFVTVVLLSFMGKMRAFNVVWVLTNGGPMHFSETVATYIQKRAFNMGLDLGYPSAMAVVWFGVILFSVGLLSIWLRGRSALQS
jgi:multiple sugar transport system permease protein/raffinose/stachyose/melibiose transport system permease protein